MKNELDVHRRFELAHDVEQLVAGLVEVDALALAAEHGRGGAEVAAQRAADRRDDAWRPRRRGVSLTAMPTLRVPMPESISGWRIGLVRVFAQEPAEPAHALALDDVVGVDPLAQVGHVGDVPADDDRRLGLILADQLAHLLAPCSRLGMIDVMPMTSYCCVRISSMKRSSVGKSEQRAGGLDVRLDEHQAPTAMEHPQRERALRPRHLVVVQLHRVHRPAAVLVVLGVRAEDAGQENLGLRTLGMNRRRRVLGRMDGATVVGGLHGSDVLSGSRWPRSAPRCAVCIRGIIGVVARSAQADCVCVV